jgi:hypothetical protein
MTGRQLESPAVRGLSAFAGALLLLVPIAFGFRTSAPLRVYPGPADPAWSVDLPSRYRVGKPSFFRWLGRGGLDLPFRLGAPGVLVLDYEIARPALAVVRADSRIAGELQLRTGFSQARLLLPEGRRLLLRFEETESDPEERRRASFLRIQIESARLYPTLRAVAAAGALPLLLCLLLVLGRLPFPVALALGFIASVLEAWWIGVDPYVSIRLTERLLAPIGFFGGIAALAIRRSRWSSWVYAAFLVGLVLRLGIVLHPYAYHYDHAAHAGMVQALLDRGPAAFWKEQEALQLALHVGEIEVGGEKRALPYPTLFYLVAAAVTPLTGSVDAAMMLTAGLAAAAEVWLVAFLAGALLESERGRIASAFAAAIYPATYGLLTLALYPSMVAHVFELAALALLARELFGTPVPGRAHTVATLGVIALAGSIHAGAFLNLAVFCGVLAVASGRIRPLWLGGIALSMSLLVSYSGYLDLLPVLGNAPREAPYSSYWLQLEPPQQFAFMGGYLWPLLGMVGIGFLMTRLPPSQARFVLAWGVAFVVMRALRAGLGPPGAHLKELQFVAPLVALGIGEACDRISMRARILGPAVVAVLALIAGKWILYHERWLLPVASVEGEREP